MKEDYEVKIGINSIKKIWLPNDSLYITEIFLI